jgi:hypothetical protein
MSLFANPLYDYWQSRFTYLWSIKHVQLTAGLMSIIDARAYTLLLLTKQLTDNPNTEYNADDFGYIPLSYEDLTAFSFIANTNLKANKFQLLNRTIVYIP